MIAILFYNNFELRQKEIFGRQKKGQKFIACFSTKRNQETITLEEKKARDALIKEFNKIRPATSNNKYYVTKLIFNESYSKELIKGLKNQYLEHHSFTENDERLNLIKTLNDSAESLKEKSGNFNELLRNQQIEDIILDTQYLDYHEFHKINNAKSETNEKRIIKKKSYKQLLRNFFEYSFTSFLNSAGSKGEKINHNEQDLFKPFLKIKQINRNFKFYTFLDRQNESFQLNYYLVVEITLVDSLANKKNEFELKIIALFDYLVYFWSVLLTYDINQNYHIFKSQKLLHDFIRKMKTLFRARYSLAYFIHKNGLLPQSGWVVMPKPITSNNLFSVQDLLQQKNLVGISFMRELLRINAIIQAIYENQIQKSYLDLEKLKEKNDAVALEIQTVNKKRKKENKKNIASIESSELSQDNKNEEVTNKLESENITDSNDVKLDGNAK